MSGTGHSLSAGDLCVVCGRDNAAENVDQPDGSTEWWCIDCLNYLRAVLDFHQPNTPPSTCMWCGLPSPCAPYREATRALGSATGETA
jgi:hypothetical protein